MEDNKVIRNITARASQKQAGLQRKELVSFRQEGRQEKVTTIHSTGSLKKRRLSLNL